METVIPVELTNKKKLLKLNTNDESKMNVK